ncbi:MAG: S8 family serine peptidase [Gammaproteobacteria bacterium]|nr:S8 family serine peptidase [Gammaproteobacteria bacterium]
MNRKLLYLLLVFTALLVPATQSMAARPAHAGQARTAPSGSAAAVRIAPRHILVKLDAAADVPAFMSHAKKHGLHKHGRVYGSNWYTLSIPAQANPRAAAARARHFPDVILATVDPVVRLDQIPPRDPLYRDDDDPSTKCIPGLDEGCVELDVVDQWGLFKAEAEGAWNETTGSTSVVIAVLDSGVDLDHDDLIGQIWVNPGEIDADGIDNDSNGLVDDYHGADFVGDNVGDPLTDNPSSEDGDPDIPMGIWDPEVDISVFIGDPSVGDGVDNDGDGLPDLGVFHGTAVAALAAAMTDNLAVELPIDYEYEGMAGVCWGCKIMPVRMVNAEGQGFGSDAASAIYYATDMGADVMNLSWGFDLDTLDATGVTEVAIITDAIDYATSQGVIVVASSGNSYTEAVHFPAAMISTLAVGASNWLDQRSAFSSYAPVTEIPDNGVDDDGNGRIDDVVDVVAPGEAIWSGYVYSVFEAQYSYLFGDFETRPGLDAYENVTQGTSFAAPLVSGYVGLLLSRHPGATLGQLREIIRSNAVDILDPEGVGDNLVGYDQYTGFGRLRMVIPENLPDLNGLDSDSDGLSDTLEATVGTNPLSSDSDGDSLTDYQEVAWDGDNSVYSAGLDTDPLNADTDSDGIIDGAESLAGTDPLDADSTFVWGDINNDGAVNAADVLLATRAALGTLTLDSPQLARGNVAPLVSGQPSSMPDDDFNVADLLLITGKATGVMSF